MEVLKNDTTKCDKFVYIFENRTMNDLLYLFPYGRLF